MDLANHHSKVGPYIRDAEILLTFGGMMADDVLTQAGSLKWIQALGTGVDGIVDQPSLPENVLVTNMRGIHGPPVSETTIMLMLALCRDFPRAIRNQDLHAWDRFMPSLLWGKTVGILGVGVIAEELAHRCQAFGMKVVGITSTLREVTGFDQISHRDDLVQVVPELDFFVILAPYTPENDGLVSRGVLAAMKPTAFLVNVSRGGVVDEDALLTALDGHQFAAAALDVFREEPLPPDSPFWGMNNVIISPKQGGYCDEYIDFAFPIIEENMRRYLTGSTATMINPVKTCS